MSHNQRRLAAGAQLPPKARMAIGAAAVAFALQALLAVSVDLHLFGDGVWHLISLASSGRFYYWISDGWTELYRSRAATTHILQAPTLLAVLLGVRSLHVLSVVFGLTLYLHPAASAYFCWRYLRGNIVALIPVLSLFAGAMNSAAYIVTDGQFIVSIYWPVLMILLFPREMSRGMIGLLIALSVPLLLAYESMAVFGIVLAGVCVRNIRAQLGPRWLYATLAVWYFAGVALAVAAILWPHDPSNRGGFVTSLMLIFSAGYIPVKASMAVVVCTSAILLLPQGLGKMKTAVFWAGLAAGALMVLQVVLAWAPSSLNEQIQARTTNFTTPLMATALLFVLVLGRLQPDAGSVTRAACLIAALGCAQSLWNMSAALRWSSITGILRHELSINKGPLTYRQSVMSRAGLGPLRPSELHASWPLLPLSLYLAENGQVQAVVVPPEGTFIPFDPYAPERFPDLSAYGVRYDLYREASSRAPQVDLGQVLSFTQGGTGLGFIGSGWSHPEAWATWTEGQQSSLTLPVQTPTSGTDIKLNVRLAPHLAPGQPHLTVDVVANGTAVGQWAFDYKPTFEICERDITIPADAFRKKSPLELSFRIHETLRSPAELSGASDPRKLGLAFVSLVLKAAQ